MMNQTSSRAAFAAHRVEARRLRSIAQELLEFVEPVQDGKLNATQLAEFRAIRAELNRLKHKLGHLLDPEDIEAERDAAECDFDYKTATIGAGTYCRTHRCYHFGT